MFNFVVYTFFSFFLFEKKNQGNNIFSEVPNLFFFNMLHLLYLNNNNIFIEFITFLRSPIEKYPFYMLIETSGSNMNHDEEKLTNFLESSMEQGIVLDGTVTNEPTKMRVRSRHRITATRMSTANPIFPEHLEAP